jgi:hypothetical protein
MLVIATVGSAWVLHNTDDKIGKQAEIANDQLKAMLNDERPWVKVEGTIDKSFPIAFDATHMAAIPFRAKLTNTGKSPAFNVRVLALAFVPFPTSPA